MQNGAERWRFPDLGCKEGNIRKVGVRGGHMENGAHKIQIQMRVSSLTGIGLEFNDQFC